jgi:hypothetical protein
MAACDSKPWDMTLILDEDPTPIELRFENVTIFLGVIIGEVHDRLGNKVSNLIGTCTPFVGGGAPNVSEMTFVFRLRDAAKEVGIFLSGFAFLPSTATFPDFRGRFLAFTVGTNTPLGEVRNLVIPDPGDTGTGNGTQT